MSIRSVVCPVHVGRDEELTALSGSAAAVRVGGRTLLISGEAGVGKSRMAAEAVRLATDASWVLMPGPCEEVGAAAYGPLATALRRHVRTLDRAATEALFDGPARLASSLLPEVSSSLGTTAPADTAREHVHASVWHLLARIGEKQPVLLLLEDLHWADPDSLRLVTHLVREAPTLPLWLVVTYRSDELHRRHPLTPLLAQWRRLPRVDEIRLQPLEREALRSMISALFGGTDVGDEFVDAVRERTEGNPFFIEELCAVLVERGDIFEAGGEWDRRDLDEIEMPESVRETLLTRCTRLDSHTSGVLRLAAIAGERIDPQLLAFSAGIDPDAVDGVLIQGLDHHLLVEGRHAGARHYAFRHALTREALADDLIGPERRRAHRRVAEALCATRKDDVDAVAAEISDHFLEAGDVQLAAEYALRAGRRAAAQHAPVAAASHFNRVLRLLPEDDQARLGLLLEAAAASYTDSERNPSMALAVEAHRLAQEVGDPVSEAQALRWLWQDRWRSGDSEGAVALSAEALRLVEGRDDWTEAWTRQANLRHLALTGSQNDEVRALVPGALEVATRAGHMEALSQIHNTRGIIAAFEGENIEAFEAAAQCAVAAHAPDAEVSAWQNGGYSALWIGHMRRGREWLARALELAERETPARTDYPRAGLSWAHALTGELDAALATAASPRDSGDIPARMVALTALTEVHLRRGDLALARECAEENWRVAAANGEGQRIDPALAHLVAVRVHDGMPQVEEIIERFLSGAWRPGNHALATPNMSHALVVAGAGQRLRRLTEITRDLTSQASHAHNRAALALCEGRLSAVEADAEAARRWLQEAVVLYRDMPCPAREAEALLDIAELELREGRPADATTAGTAARRLAESLGSPPLLDAAGTLLALTDTDLVLATVLVTDMVGSTERAAAMGDRAWRTLLHRHHDIVRRQLVRHRGREIDTAGDGFLAAFDSPARAIACARAVVGALHDAGIEVRAGLHTGECEVLGDKLTGIVVHTAARVAGSAVPGEVLVSTTVRDVVAGSGIGFTDRGVHLLRGVPGEWRLFAVESPVRAVTR